MYSHLSPWPINWTTETEKSHTIASITTNFVTKHVSHSRTKKLFYDFFSVIFFFGLRRFDNSKEQRRRNPGRSNCKWNGNDGWENKWKLEIIYSSGGAEAELRFLARTLARDPSATSALSPASSNSCCTLRYLARFMAAISSASSTWRL